jgi:hypothetical protein
VRCHRASCRGLLARIEDGGVDEWEAGGGVEAGGADFYSLEGCPLR